MFPSILPSWGDGLRTHSNAMASPGSASPSLVLEEARGLQGTLPRDRSRLRGFCPWPGRPFVGRSLNQGVVRNCLGRGAEKSAGLSWEEQPDPCQLSLREGRGASDRR